MTLKGWTLPQSPTGRSSLLPPPPWHYSGEIISADFTADPDRVAELLPPGMTPMGGRQRQLRLRRLVLGRGP